MSSFFIGIILLLVSGSISAIFTKRYKIIVLSVLNFIASALCITPAIKVLTENITLTKSINLAPIFNTVTFQIDNLSAFFILIIGVMSFISAIYSKGYLEPYVQKGKSINSHLIFFSALNSSMLAVVTCHNALMFLICWEIMSLSSFFLVLFENEKKEVCASAIKYLVFMHFSVIFIIIAFAILTIKSNSYDFASFVTILQTNKHLADVIFILFFIGFGTKAGFVPFHNWLPDAHPSAPSHVSALMSGVMIKTGIYGILRTISLMETPSKLIVFSVLLISLITALYGVLYAISQKDIKKLLAYSSIENIGIIGIGISFGLIGVIYQNSIITILGFAGAFLHIINHSIFKELLFFAAGSVYKKTHTRDMEKLGGLIKSMPKSTLLFLIGAIAICGLPPLNGFISEFTIYLGMFNALKVNNFFVIVISLISVAGLALVGTMAILAFSKAYSIIFLGNPRSEASENADNDNDNSMIIPMGFLAAMAILIGTCADSIFAFILKPVCTVCEQATNSLALISEPIGIMRTVSIYAITLLVAILATIMIKTKLTGNKISLHETWGCGYDRANNKMQYTASSYAGPFLSMLKPLFKKVFDIEKPRKLFPTSSHFNLEIEDIEEAYIINPLVKYDEWFLSKFETIQSGNIQSYIKYSLIFLVIVLIGSFFIG